MDRRRGEVVLAISVLMLIVAAYTIVKAVRDAVFLSRFGVTELSLVAIGLALVAGMVVAGYERLSHGVPRPRIIAVSHVVIAASLAAMWPILSQDEPHELGAWLLYIWSSLFGVFIVAQFWLLAGELFDVREARRYFAPIGAGAIAGGLVGGACAQFLAARLRAENLLLLAAAMLLVAAALARRLWRHRARDAPADRVLRPGARRSTPPPASLLGQPFVRAIALGLLLSTVATTLLDWQLKAIAKHAYAGDADRMAAFFGSLFTYQSGLSLAFQLLITGWLLKRLKIGAGRLALPLALLVGSLAVLGHAALPFGVLAAAAGAKVAEGTLRFGVDRSVVELTWLPLPREQRDKDKSFVDTVVDRVATGVTGVIWLGLAALGLGDPERVHLVSIAVIAVIAAWLWTALMTQRHYVDAFRESLERRSIDLQSLTMTLGMSEARRTLAEALASDAPEQVQFGLYLVSGSELPLPDLSRPLAHRDAGVRLATLTLLAERDDDRHRAGAEALLDDPDLRVREAAIAYLGRVAPAAFDPGEPVPLSRALVALSDPASAPLAEARVAEALAAGDVAQIQLVGAAPADSAARLLRPLLSHPDASVVRAALQAAGRAGAVDLVDALAGMLGDPHWRPRAALAIADMGAPALRRLLPLLDRDGTPLATRRTLVRLLGASRDKRFAAPLIAQVGVPDLRGAAIRSLARLHAAAGISVPAARVDGWLEAELRELYRGLIMLGRGSWPRARVARDDDDLWLRSLREDTTKRVRRCFALLSTKYRPGDVRTAQRAVSSALGPVRARGVEFLDNLITGREREQLLPALDDLDPRRLEPIARALGVQPEPLERSLAALVAGEQRWLRLVACWKIGHDRIAALRGDLERIHDDDPELHQLAQRALCRLDAREPDMALTVVDKALQLRAVDVLSDASAEDLAYVAQIAEEREVDAGTVLYREGDAPDALYVVIDGEIELSQGGESLGTAGPGEAFGSWALVDESPRVAGARARTRATLLCVDREDFIDLLADRPDIVQAVFKAMVQRIRALAELTKAV